MSELCQTCLHVFTFVFFLSLIPPEAVSFDERHIVVAPSFPRGKEIGARGAEFFREFDLDEFFDNVVAANKCRLGSGHTDPVVRPVIGRHDWDFMKIYFFGSFSF